MTTVLVADDQPLIRSALVALISTADGIQVVAEAGDGREALRLAVRHEPDVVVMDVRMPVMDGLAATGLIRAQLPCTSVLVLTTYDLDDYVFAAIRAGASGFLLKDGDGDDLVRAIRRCAAGEAVMAPGSLRRLFDEFARGRAPDEDAVRLVAGLSEREHEVLEHLAAGATNDEIAAALVIARPTVKTHVASVLAKLGVRDRTQAAVVAHRAGLS